jgi:restriction system protein
MGAIWFEKCDFADHLHEIIGYKSGVAASIEHMCDLLSGTGFDEKIIQSEQYGLRIRSEDYDALYYKLLHGVGVTERPLDGIFEVFKVTKEIERKKGLEFAQSIQEIYGRHMKIETKKARQNGLKAWSPEKMIKETAKVHGAAGLDAIKLLIRAYDDLMKHSPRTSMRFHKYSNIINLSDLFQQHNPSVASGDFLDQRFLDFLANNTDKLGEIHWRKFEELTAECFKRFGYIVELGPGANDDGVDMRVWDEAKEGTPKFIVQCKRTKSKIEKVTIKGLYADVQHEGSELGVLVTSSELSVGARATIEARSYPVEEVNRENIIKWLSVLRTPGTGIVRL